ncbi:acyltransferase [Brachybacterium sp. EF45031]|nr:acyltransferase [Brachybacterium sillae]
MWLNDPEPEPDPADPWLQEAEEDDLASESAGEDAWSTERAARQTDRTTAPPADAAALNLFRAELHGLRALAIALVAAYHVWLGRVSGGVDVFLFLSAFFLTRTFRRRLVAGRPLAVPRYWVRTFKRLLPPAAVTIAATLAATAWLLPPSLWDAVQRQGVASVLYVQNLELIRAAVDYEARDAGAASPLQHFWSLSVQGQLFLLWPLLVLLVSPIARRTGRPVLVLTVLFGLIGAASLTWSVVETAANQPVAYFDTLTRVWEFAAGTLLALLLPVIDRALGARRPEEGEPPRGRVLRALLGWVGVAALLAVGLLLDVRGAFPGWIALWPLAAASLIVIAGHSGTRWGADRVLSSRPMRWLGDISYAFYLVHWPVLVLWLASAGLPRAGLLDGTVVLAASALLAWLLTRLVDAPIRRSAWLDARWPRALAVAVTSIALIVGGTVGWRTALARTPAPEARSIASDGVLTTPPAEVVPHGWQLDREWPTLPHECAGRYDPPTDFPHTHCQMSLPASATVTGVMVVVGSSHARQFIPALETYASERGWMLVNIHMDGCPFTRNPGIGAYCAGYEGWAQSYLQQVDPVLVATTASQTSPDGPAETLPVGTAEAIQAVLDRGTSVLALRDTPRWPQDQFACAEDVLESGGSPADADAACGAPAAEKLAPADPLAPLATLTGAEGARVTTLDLSDTICPDGRCSPVLGTIQVYLDDDHLTRTFTEEALEPVVTERLRQSPPVP